MKNLASLKVLNTIYLMMVIIVALITFWATL